MLEEVEAAARLEHPADLGEGAGHVGDGAQREPAERGIADPLSIGNDWPSRPTCSTGIPAALKRDSARAELRIATATWIERAYHHRRRRRRQTTLGRLTRSSTKRS